jgi:hypothetical protein
MSLKESKWRPEINVFSIAECTSKRDWNQHINVN